MSTTTKTLGPIFMKGILVQIVVQKLRERGCDLSTDEINSITVEFPTKKDEVLQIELPDPFKELEIEITQKDFDDMWKDFEPKMPSIINNAASNIGIGILENLKSRAPQMLQEHETLKDAFEQRLKERWGNAFDLFKMFIVIALEAGEEYNREFRSKPKKSKDFLSDVLTRLHARACQVANEILTLIRSGYADGAHARWRTLHEVAVVSCFIAKHGQDTAERYFHHNVIESYKAAKQYQEYCTRLKDQPLSQEEIDDIKSKYDELINRFGRQYKTSYGWAAQALGKNEPNFSDIEKAINLDHIRPNYKLASHGVHANPKGILFKLGLFPYTANTLLSGPSNIGFTDPAHASAISLTQITTSLLSIKPTLERLAVMNILLLLTDEIGETFWSIEKSIRNISENK